MQPELHLGPITLQSFGLMMGLGFVVAGLLASKRLKEIGRPADWAYEMVFAALVGGIAGARAWSVIENWDEAKDDLLGSIFSGSGLVFYGGLFGGALGVILWARWRGVLDARTCDVAAPGLAAAYAIGRIGCQLAGDGDYGKAWDGPWAMSYPDGTVPTTEQGPPDARLRDADHGRSSPGSCGASATATAPAGCSRSTSCSRAPSASSSSSCAATTPWRRG